MNYINRWRVFEGKFNLSDTQMDFLDHCTIGTWKVNPQTALIDILGSFNCDDMNLDDFKGIRFGKITKTFSCDDNNLKTLDGSPREVGENFWCFRNPLISLEEAPSKIVEYFGFQNYYSEYNTKAFFEELERDRPGVAELLLTHHFLTPQVIKEEITKNSYFCYYVSKAWNNPPFKKKQDELTRILSQEDLQKIDALWSIGGYL